MRADASPGFARASGFGAGEGAPLRILLVEDDPADAMLLRQQLSNGMAGRHEIVPAHNLAAALDLVSRGALDVALLDLDLGDSQGKSSYDRIRSARPDLPVIVLSGCEDIELADALLRDGAQDCLIKGTPLDALLPRAIRHAIGRHGARLALEESLRRVSESEAQTRSLIDANADAVLIVGMDGAIRFANPAASRMFGKSSRIGTDLGEAIGNGIPVEIDIVQDDGGRGVAELRVSRARWEGEEVFLASIRDVTARVETERALRRSEQRLIASERHLESAQRVGGSGSFELCPANQQCSCSTHLLEMLGAQAAPVSWGAFVEMCFTPATRSRVREMVDFARSGAQAGSVDCEFRRADGAVRIAQLRCDRLSDNPERVVGVVHDITELRQAQAKQAELEEQLRQAQKLEALGTLAGGIAHDLNNTLVPITTMAPLLLEAAESDFQRQCVNLILEAADRAKSLVKQVLAFSRTDEGEQEPAYLDELVRGAMRIICVGLPVQIQCRIEIEKVPPVLANQGQLYQALLNLVSNAVQAIGDAPGEILIEVGPGGDGGARLCVEDDGPGMDDATRRRIFEPFFTTKAAGDGAGLGLAVVSGIMRDHEATIAVTSSPGNGTRFEIGFPPIPHA